METKIVTFTVKKEEGKMKAIMKEFVLEPLATIGRIVLATMVHIASSILIIFYTIGNVTAKVSERVLNKLDDATRNL